ncbi:MAG: mannose-1-phosphate guanylyltransferase [Bacteroidales bacterium]|nr:mannose-1-phosphate guanylyltransferase [Bacteroidales bacterium]
MKNRYIVIMAGGAGTRFWPLSRDVKPKQFLDILGTGTTLLQDTVNRFEGLCPRENIIIVTNESYRDLVKEQVDIPVENILTEPMRRNTAPCVAYAAFRILKRDPDALMLVSPADHLIKQRKEFQKVINECFEFISGDDVLLTLGMKPDRPETGYGYIQANIKKPVEAYKNLMKVKTFTEKPKRELAEIFLRSGDFYWNSGIFLWRASTIISAFEVHLHDMYSTFDLYKDQLGTEEEEDAVTRIYSECLSISIDYGIMEKADNVYVRCSNFGWSDLGTWSSLGEHNHRDRDGNSGTLESVFSYGVKDSIIKLPEGKIAVVQGLKDYIIVDSGDVLLIVERKEEQDIKKYIEDISDRMGDDLL